MNYLITVIRPTYTEKHPNIPTVSNFKVKQGIQL